MTKKIIQLPLDLKMDRDILDRLRGIPKTRRMDWIRSAMRVYMTLEKGEGPLPTIPALRPTVFEHTHQGDPYEH